MTELKPCPTPAMVAARTHEYARLVKAARNVVKGYASNTGNPSELMHELDEASLAAIKETRNA